MFTGLVQEAGRLVRLDETEGSLRMVVETREVGRDARVGDSIAVDGCCLTVVEREGDEASRRLRFDLLRETWNRTRFQDLTLGDPVNLEPSLRADSRLGGHFVTGHVDGVGCIEEWEPRGADRYLRISAPGEVMRYLIPKGSIAVNGISLTVAEVHRDSFAVWIIRHTLEVTSLRSCRVGGRVNLESDLLGKYVDRLLEFRADSTSRPPAPS